MGLMYFLTWKTKFVNTKDENYIKHILYFSFGIPPQLKNV